MQIDIVVYVRTDRCRPRRPFVPPSVGIRLAALTPVCHAVRVIHPPVERVSLATNASLVCLLFDRRFVSQAYQFAITLTARGKVVVMGGSYATRQPDEALEHCAAVLVGAIEPAWPRLLADVSAGRLRLFYKKTAVRWSAPL